MATSNPTIAEREQAVRKRAEYLGYRVIETDYDNFPFLLQSEQHMTFEGVEEVLADICTGRGPAVYAKPYAETPDGMAETTSEDSQTTESFDAIDRGLTAIWGAAEGIEGENLSHNCDVGVAILIRHEAWRLMEKLETVKKALGVAS